MAIKKTSTVTKAHGPKTNRFHGYNKSMRLQMANSTMINKYCNAEAFVQSNLAKGVTTMPKFMGMFVGRK